MRELQVRAAFLSVLSVLALTAALSAQSPAPPPSGSLADHLTFPNLISAAVLIYHFGILRHELKKRGEQVDRLMEWRDKETGVGGVFARRDVTDQRLKAIEEKVRAIHAMVAELRRDLHDR